MAGISRPIVAALVFVCCVNLSRSIIQESLSKFLGSLAAVKHVRTPELLNQLCNESQGTDTVRRDACYGCFFRATNQPAGFPMLLAMSTCANTYLNNTDYGHCQLYLSNATSSLNTRASPTTIYCTFLECIRQVNKDSLDALRNSRGNTKALKNFNAPNWPTKRSTILLLKFYAQSLRNICILRERDTDANTVRPGAEPIDPRGTARSTRSTRSRGNYILTECVGEAVRMFPNFNNTDVQLAQLFVNTTACVLAKTRCAFMNPITGEYQEEDLPNKLQVPSINAILVNTDYDFNIVHLPFRYTSIDICAKYRNLAQAGWPTVTC